MRKCEGSLARWHVDDENIHKLDEVSGIGLLTASTLKTSVGQPERFASDRNKADNNHDLRDRLNAWPPLRELQTGLAAAD